MLDDLRGRRFHHREVRTRSALFSASASVGATQRSCSCVSFIHPFIRPSAFPHRLWVVRMDLPCVHSRLVQLTSGRYFNPFQCDDLKDIFLNIFCWNIDFAAFCS